MAFEILLSFRSSEVFPRTVAWVRAMAVESAAVGRLACTLVGSVGFALRRSRKLPLGPRREVIEEHLAVALSLLAELADKRPEVVRAGGLECLAKLACRPSPQKANLNDTVVVLEDAPVATAEVIHEVVSIVEYTNSDDVASERELVSDMHVTEQFLHTQAPCVDPNPAVASALLTEPGKVHMFEANCTPTAAATCVAGRALGKGIGAPSNAAKTQWKPLGAASLSSKSSSSSCPSSESSDASLDGARVGSRSLATGKGIGLYRRVVPAPQTEPVESNSGLTIASGPALLVELFFARLRAQGIDADEYVRSSSPERLEVALQDVLRSHSHFLRIWAIGLALLRVESRPHLTP